MAKQKKKKVSAKKAAPRKAKPRKVSAKKVRASANPRETLLGRNHRERKMSPFTRKQKEKLLNLRDAMVDSMAGVAQDTFVRALKAAKLRRLECIRPTPAPTLTIAISRSVCFHKNKMRF